MMSLIVWVVLGAAAYYVVAVAGSTVMTEEIWQNWEQLSLPEQLSYLIDDSELLTLKEEYDLLGQATLADMLEAHEEFQNPSTTTAFFQACDRDGDGYITFQELCICRGDFDRFGVPNDTSEWASRADAILGDFEDAMTKRRQGGDEEEEDRDESGHDSGGDEACGDVDSAATFGEGVLVAGRRAISASAAPSPKLTFADIPPIEAPMKRER